MSAAARFTSSRLSGILHSSILHRDSECPERIFCFPSWSSRRTLFIDSRYAYARIVSMLYSRLYHTQLTPAPFLFFFFPLRASLLSGLVSYVFFPTPDHSTIENTW